MIVARQALPGDAEAVRRIARLLRLEGRDLNSVRQTGFFLYVGSVDDYRGTLSESSYCYVAFEGEECAGFLTTTTPEALAKLPPGGNRDLFDEGGQFPLLIEQIGVAPQWQNRGVGRTLMETLLGSSAASRLMATIVHAPVRNERAIRFLEKNGWRLHREVPTQKRLWGFYELRR